MSAIALLLALLDGNARVRSVHHPPEQRILWVGAHPDDEAFVAPILGRDCVESGATCTLLVFTRGERGDCFLPQGCGNLGATRTAEMAQAAGLLHAQLTLWSFSDISADVDSAWSAEAGGRDALLDRIASVIAATAPAVIYTFDPSHGSTCHPAHREVGALVLEAAARTSAHVEMVETRVEFLRDDIMFHPIAPDVPAFDATSTWDYIVRDVAIHASQFTPAQVESLRHAPSKQRHVWLSAVPVALEENLCASNDDDGRSVFRSPSADASQLPQRRVVSMRYNAILTTMRNRILFITALWIAFLCVGIFHALVAPMWDGFDEPGHLAYILFIADHGRPPGFSELSFPKFFVDANRYLPSAVGHGAPTFVEWRAMSSDQRDRSRAIADQLAQNPNRYRTYISSNYERQQGPVFYFLAAVPGHFLRDLPLPKLLVSMRLFCVFLASIAVPISAAVLLRIGDDAALAIGLPVVALAPNTLFAFDRVSNESLVFPLMAGITFALVSVARKGSFRDCWLLGLLRPCADTARGTAGSRCACAAHCQSARRAT